MRPSLTWPKPWPPRSGGRWAAHRPRSLTCSLSGAMARSKPSWPSSSKTVSIGQISSRTNSRIQSSCCWNSGSVEKSHAMSVPPPSGRCPQGWQVIRRWGVVGALEIAAGFAVLAGAALQSATGFGFALVSAPLLFAATTPAHAVGLLIAARAGGEPDDARYRGPAPAAAGARVAGDAGVGDPGDGGRARRAAGAGLDRAADRRHARRVRDAGRALARPAAARRAARATRRRGRRPRPASPPARSPPRPPPRARRSCSTCSPAARRRCRRATR